MIARLIRLLTGIQCRWLDDSIGERPCCFFANHRSHLDAVAIWAALPPLLRERTRPVAAQDYWQKGPLRPFLAKRVFKAVLIQRGSFDHHDTPLMRMSAALKEEASLILFPEGGRADDDREEPGVFKSGLHHLAKAHPELDLVPVWLDRLQRILPKGEFLPVPLIGRATFGKPLHFIADESRDEFLSRCRAALAALPQEQEP